MEIQIWSHRYQYYYRYDEHKLIIVHIFDVSSASQAWQEICQLQLEDSIWAELKT